MRVCVHVCMSMCERTCVRACVSMRVKGPHDPCICRTGLVVAALVFLHAAIHNDRSHDMPPVRLSIGAWHAHERVNLLCGTRGVASMPQVRRSAADTATALGSAVGAVPHSATETWT